MTINVARSGFARLMGMVLIGAAAAIVGAEGQAFAQTERTLRFGHMWPPNDVWGQGAQRFAELVKQRTGGKYDVRVYPSGQLGNEREMEEGLQLGRAVAVRAQDGGVCAALHVPRLRALECRARRSPRPEGA